MLIDSHCHLNCLDLAKYDGQLEGVMTAAKDAGVTHMLCVCIDLKAFPEVLAIAEQYPHVTASVGIHPNEPAEDSVDEVTLLKLADHPKIVAIGETGLDYFRSQGDVDWQRERFKTHIHVAKQCQKPLIIHTRDAAEDTIAIMQEENAGEVGGVMHCFTGTWEMAQQYLAMGFYISFSGIVTFKNAKDIQEAARQMPLDRMLVETDSPYLAPMPHRGKTNEPAYVRHVTEFIAELRGISYEEVAEVTSNNFFKLFGTV